MSMIYIAVFADFAEAHNPWGVKAVSVYFGYSYLPGAIMCLLALIASRLLIVGLAAWGRAKLITRPGRAKLII